MENLIIIFMFLIASLVSYLNKQKQPGDNQSAGWDEDILRELLAPGKSNPAPEPVAPGKAEPDEYFDPVEDEYSFVESPKIREPDPDHSRGYTPPAPPVFSDIRTSIPKSEDRSLAISQSPNDHRRKVRRTRFGVHSRAELKKAFILREIIERPRAFDI